MNMALLFPAALTGLIALIVPLILHIARRSEQQPTTFAALRWLRQKPRPRSRLRFDEWPLLLIRLMLLMLAVLWLTKPVLFGAADRSPYVAIVPGAAFDPASFAGHRVHWLAPGFPTIEQPQPSGPPPIASLIRQIDAELPTGTPLTIITPAILTGADANRLHLSRKVTWRVAGKGVAATHADPVDPPALSVRADADHGDAVRYIRAAALAWQPAGRTGDIDSAGMDAPLPDKRRVLIWLAGGTIPNTVLDWVKAGGTMLAASDARLPADRHTQTLWHDDQGVPLAQAMALDAGRFLRFTRPLRPTDMPALLEADFPVQLQALIAPMPAPTRVAAADYAPTPGGRTYDQPPRSFQPWVAILIALLFLAERWMATRRSRGIAP